MSISDWREADPRRILEESDDEFENRVLTALYEFVHGLSGKVLERRDHLILVAAYDEKIARLEEENAVQSAQRDSEFAQLRAEIDRLEHDNKRIEEESLMHSAQRDSVNVQLRAEIDRLKLLFERENMQLRDEITRLEHVNTKLNSFANCTMLMLACIYVFVLQFVFARL